MIILTKITLNVAGKGVLQTTLKFSVFSIFAKTIIYFNFHKINVEIIVFKNISLLCQEYALN